MKHPVYACGMLTAIACLLIAIYLLSSVKKETKVDAIPVTLVQIMNCDDQYGNGEFIDHQSKKFTHQYHSSLCEDCCRHKTGVLNYFIAKLVSDNPTEIAVNPGYNPFNEDPTVPSQKIIAWVCLGISGCLTLSGLIILCTNFLKRYLDRQALNKIQNQMETNLV